MYFAYQKSLEEQHTQQIFCNHFSDNTTKAIDSYVSGNGTEVVLPTGYGKSVVYAALPVIFNKQST